MLESRSDMCHRYMRSIFSPYCTIIEAKDGQEALAMCQTAKPDLIISDVMMPNVGVDRSTIRCADLGVKLDGFGLLAALRKSKELRVIPVIML